MKLFDLSGRTAVVVGGTSGIGRTLALGLADAGADVVATGRRIELVEDVAAEIRAAAAAARCRLPPTSPMSPRSSACATRASRPSARSTSSLAVAGTTKQDADARDGRGRLASRSSTPTSPARCARVRCSARTMVGAEVRPHHHASPRCRRSSACSRWRPTWRARRRVAGLTRALAVEWAPLRRHGERASRPASSGPISTPRCSTRRAGRSS